MFEFLKDKKGEPPALPEGTVRRRYSIEGQVQGVGFRYRARYAAQSLELTGWVENEDDGSVTLEVQGDPVKFRKLFALIQRSDYIQITAIRQKDIAPGSAASRCAAIKHKTYSPRNTAFRGLFSLACKVFVEGEPPGGERSGKAEEQPECRWPPDRMPATQVQRTEKRFLAGGKIGPVHRELLSSGF